MPELQLLTADHGPAILAFERENRTYFAASVPDRGDDYFTDFDTRHRALLAEQATGACLFHVLIEEGSGAVLGRFNLVDIAEGSAELGFRVAQRAAGRGVATATVRHLCELAHRDYGITTLRAQTTTTNTGSRAVLTHTGFLPTGTTTLDGQPAVTYTRSAA